MKFGRALFGHVFSLEHSRAAYLADFALLYVSIAALMIFLLATGTRERAGAAVGFVLLGLAGWTVIEYLLHRFVLHGLEPFQRWHALHHRRQTDLIYAPTILIASVVTGLAFLAAWMLGDPSRACALLLGLLIGYLVYSITHHAVHHWRGSSTWLRQRKRWHSLHHRPGQPAGRYGVTTAFWDHVFRTAAQPRLGRYESRATPCAKARDESISGAANGKCSETSLVFQPVAVSSRVG